MIGKDDEIKIIDFGLAKEVKKEKLNTEAGTPYYMAPEVVKGKYGPECDVWSVGVILYIMLSGHFPFNGNNKKQLYTQILF